MHAGFLFQTGSIKSRKKHKKSRKKHTASFYSKLVRLKAVTDQVTAYADAQFLFQTGSIKRVTIAHLGKHIIRFYSKLVRLKVAAVVQPLSASAVSIPNWFD